MWRRRARPAPVITDLRWIVETLARTHRLHLGSAGGRSPDDLRRCPRGRRRCVHGLAGLRPSRAGQRRDGPRDLRGRRADRLPRRADHRLARPADRCGRADGLRHHEPVLRRDHQGRRGGGPEGRLRAAALGHLRDRPGRARGRRAHAGPRRGHRAGELADERLRDPHDRQAEAARAAEPADQRDLVHRHGQPARDTAGRRAPRHARPRHDHLPRGAGGQLGRGDALAGAAGGGAGAGAAGAPRRPARRPHHAHRPRRRAPDRRRRGDGRARLQRRARDRRHQGPQAARGARARRRERGRVRQRAARRRRGPGADHRRRAHAQGGRARRRQRPGAGRRGEVERRDPRAAGEAGGARVDRVRLGRQRSRNSISPARGTTSVSGSASNAATSTDAGSR